MTGCSPGLFHGLLDDGVHVAEAGIIGPAMMRVTVAAEPSPLVDRDVEPFGGK